MGGLKGYINTEKKKWQRYNIIHKITIVTNSGCNQFYDFGILWLNQCTAKTHLLMIIFSILKQFKFSWDSAQFHITVLVRLNSVWFWLVTVLLIVWPSSLLLCPFHKKLRIWWKKSFGLCQTDNPRFICIMYCYRYRQLTRKNLEVGEFSSLRRP